MHSHHMNAQIFTHLGEAMLELPKAGPFAGGAGDIDHENHGEIIIHNGLADIANKLEAVSNIAVVRLKSGDIVRHPLVAEMLDVL